MTTTDKPLTDKVWLITGAAGGLGKACALALARAGATVVLAGKTVHKLERVYDDITAANGPEPAIYPINLAGASVTDFSTLAATVSEQCGRLDGVIHAAVRFDGLMPLAQIDPVKWAAALHVNLTAPLLLTQACLPALRAASGQVVLLGDAAGTEQRAFWGSYGISKSAVTQLAHMLGEEFGEAEPIRVHGITPPPMETALRQLAFPSEPAGSLAQPETVANQIVQRITS